MDVNMSEDAYRTSRVFKLLGNPLRYRMYEVIADEKSISSGELADRLSRKVDSISYHVDKLRQLDLIYSERRGKHNYHLIKREDLIQAVKEFEEQFNREQPDN